MSLLLLFRPPAGSAAPPTDLRERTTGRRPDNTLTGRRPDNTLTGRRADAATSARRRST